MFLNEINETCTVMIKSVYKKCKYSIKHGFSKLIQFTDGKYKLKQAQKFNKHFRKLIVPYLYLKSTILKALR